MNNSTITLLSDLGRGDTSVTIARATLMGLLPGATIIDLSHNVAEYDVQQAAYLLLSAYKHFPVRTVHVIAVDVFAGNTPRMLVARQDGFYFIAPDNGILPLAFTSGIEQTRLCHECTRPYSFTAWISNAGKVVQELQNDNLASFAPCDVKKAPRMLQPRILPDGIECNILYVDRYENIVLDISRLQFDTLTKGRPFRVRIIGMDDITTISTGYNDVEKDEPLARFNSAGFLEIAFNHAPAASSLGFGSFSTGNLRYQTIKISF